MQENKGFFGTLFDFSFSHYLTTSLIQILYALGIVAVIILTIVLIVAGFVEHTAIGVILLILSPFIFFILLIAMRVYLETVVVVFRIADHSRDVAENTRPRGPAAG